MTRGRAIAVCLALTGILVVGMGVRRVEDRTLPAANQYRQRPKVIVDAGHGGFDGGAVGINGVVEKGINLAISQDLGACLEWCGFQVLYTRTTDDDTSDQGLSTTREKKTSDLYNRLDLMEENADGVVVSIHQNKFEDPSCWGAQVFYGTQQQETSSRLAEIIRGNIRLLLQPENEREIKAAYDTLFLLNNAPQTIVMVECGFVSNPREASLLSTPDYQQQMAFAIALSLLQFSQS